MQLRCSFNAFLCVLLLLLTPVNLFGQTGQASLTGTVLDPQGAAVPGASVKAIRIGTNQEFTTVTMTDGSFSFPALQPSEYKVVIETPGFKKLEKKGVILNVADKQTAGTLVLEVGAPSETVSVTADNGALQIKSVSGEIGEVVTGRQIRDLALNGRNVLDLMKTIPGVVVRTGAQVAGNGFELQSFSINGARTAQHNMTIDGSSNVDTGSNGTTHVMIGIDSIAEFKVLTSNYQAEYGRSAGGDIKIVTRSGGRDYHGTGYIFHRHEGLNANTFFNNADGRRPNGDLITPRPLYRYNYAGYNIGGPVIPTNRFRNRLFFFWAQDWYGQMVPVTSTRYVRLPTSLEVAGDFSQTKDGNGSAITIRDPLTGKQFSDNKIPASRLSSDGVAILKLFNKYVNSPATMPLYNHTSAVSSTYPRRQENIRIDYRWGMHTALFARYTQDSDELGGPYGTTFSSYNFPLTPTIWRSAPDRNAVVSLTTTISPTLVHEFTFGPSQNHLKFYQEDPTAATFSGIGLSFKPPFPYDPAQSVAIQFSGVPNQNFGTMNFYAFPYENSNTTLDFSDNFSKVWSRHVAKVGIFLQRSLKDQPAGDSMRMIFSNNASNTSNAGHPYANALLGNFDTLSEPNRSFLRGQYRYINVEWYVQDNWRIGKRLTLDYGIRFYWMQPQYDARLQAAFFQPGLWDPKKAVRLYYPGPGGTAVDPANPSVRLPAYLVGRVVPRSGDPFNGMALASDGYFPGGIRNRGVHYAPRVGFAWSLPGDGRTVLRGGCGLFYDRPSGNSLAFPAVGTPPLYVNPTFTWGNLDTVGSAAQDVALAPATNAIGADPGGYVPTITNFSLQLQREVGLGIVVSVGYVGSVGSHLFQSWNINYIPVGTLFERWAQNPNSFPGGVVPEADPTIPPIYKDKGLKFDGSKALQANLLRRYPGYGTLYYQENGGSSNYHSMQVTVNRKFAHNLSFALAYTYGKAMATASTDGTATAPYNVKQYDYKRASFDQRHTLVVNYIWNLPKASRWLGKNWLVRGALDGWEISGITRFQTGVPGELSFPSIQPATGRSITGSPDIGPRFLLTGDPTGPHTREQEFDCSVFRLPDIGSEGYGPRTYLSTLGINVWDISIFKNFALGKSDGTRRLQLRFEFFNAFNHPSFLSVNGTMTWNLAADWSDYSSKQQFSNQWVRNTRDGVSPATGRLGRALGEVSSIYDLGYRVIQLAAKLYF